MGLVDWVRLPSDALPSSPFVCGGTPISVDQTEMSTEKIPYCGAKASSHRAVRFALDWRRRGEDSSYEITRRSIVRIPIRRYLHTGLPLGIPVPHGR
jgi:hypothetical protein